MASEISAQRRAGTSNRACGCIARRRPLDAAVGNLERRLVALYADGKRNLQQDVLLVPIGLHVNVNRGTPRYMVMSCTKLDF